MGKKFSSLTTNECKVAYKEMLRNAESQWETGTTLASSGNYGNATSILIISIEEYVKALIIFFDSNGFRLRNTKGVSTFFKNHQIRYVIAYIMFVMNVFGQDIVKWVMGIKENPNKIIEFHKDIISDDNFLEKKYRFYLLRKLVMLKKEFTWFSQVDAFRQEGFYCDFDDKLKSPLHINGKEYQELFLRLVRVREVATFMIKGFDSNDAAVSKSLQKLKSDFHTNGYYQKIAGAMSMLSKSKQNPFEFLKSKVEKIIS